MSQQRTPDGDQSEPAIYEIRIKGLLDDRWSDWFDGLIITLGGDGDTRLTGPVIDQAALHGLLKRVRDLGLPLVSVSPLEPRRTDPSDVKTSPKSVVRRRRSR